MNTDTSGNKVGVEVKAKNVLEERDARQLGRNIQALKQGAISGVAMKIPKGPRFSTMVGQIKKIAATLGHTVNVIRI